MTQVTGDVSGRVRHAARGLAFFLLVTGAAALTSLRAQTCTTQAKMTATTRDALSAAALAFGNAVKAGDAAKIQAGTVAEYATNFEPTAYLVRTTAERIANDTLRVVQLYALDASKRKADDKSDAEFACLLSGTNSETDFSIASLPPGQYGFAMVEAEGDKPWLLSFLFRQEGDGWKITGFYPHARTAAGHDGVWYWRAARDRGITKDVWAAWVLLRQADTLMSPAAFVSSTHLDKLRAEERAALPPELADGLGPETPYVLKANATEYRFTGVTSEGSLDGKRLNLIVRYTAEPLADASAARARNTAAAKALLDAHKDLRSGFDGVSVFAESPGQSPFATESPVSDIH